MLYTRFDNNSPVNAHTRQPIGILHGGANVVLAETGYTLLIAFQKPNAPSPAASLGE
jgi:acyl-coenzyme A thioesterase PaaI-like protein